jgi:hypothetical protein
MSRNKSNFKLNHQGKSELKRLNIQTGEHPVGALEILWNLDFGISRRIANSARLDCSRELQ